LKKGISVNATSDPCRHADGDSSGRGFFVCHRARKCRRQLQFPEEKTGCSCYISQAGTAFSYHLLAKDQIVLINIEGSSSSAFLAEHARGQW
jgi:hypothetical protein